jgi:ferredoxin--NADP+ reductase
MAVFRSLFAGWDPMTAEEITDLRRKNYNATVEWMVRIHDELMRIRVVPDVPRPPYRPGQYTTLAMGNWEPRVPGCQEEHLSAEALTRVTRRAYSISCPILADGGELLDLNRADWFEFYIVLMRESEKEPPPALTPRLFMLLTGDRLYLGEKIVGTFMLRPMAPDDTVLFLATGTGEAPHNYMIWELLRQGHCGPILAACCVRYRQDLAYLATHEELMRRYPNYTYLPLTTRELAPGSHKVYIQDLIVHGTLEERLGQPLDPKRTHVYLCGNPAMIGIPRKDPQTGQRVYPEPLGVIEVLERRGFRADAAGEKHTDVAHNVHYEKYW